MPSPWMVDALAATRSTSMSITNRLDGAACVLLTAAWSVLIDTAASLPPPPPPHAAAVSASATTIPTERQPSSHRALRPGIRPPYARWSALEGAPM